MVEMIIGTGIALTVWYATLLLMELVSAEKADFDDDDYNPYMD